MSDPNRRTVHVALVGTTGVGKSTLVNVLTHSIKDREIAIVNNDVKPCTPRAKEYVVKEGGTEYCIWDTRGLNEASQGTSNRMLKFCRLIPSSERELKKLLRGNNPRFDLVLLCIDRGKSRAKDSWKIYNLIHAKFCKGRLKVAVVVTQMGKTEYEGSKWKQTCKDTAKGVVEVFPNGLMEAVPVFEHPPDDAEVKECKSRILTLISNAC